MIFDFNNIVDYFIQRNLKKAEPKIELHDWFAWYPVKVESYRWVWLIVVLRKYKSNDHWPVEMFTKRYHEPSYYEKIYMKNIMKVMLDKKTKLCDND